MKFLLAFVCLLIEGVQGQVNEEPVSAVLSQADPSLLVPPTHKKLVQPENVQCGLRGKSTPELFRIVGGSPANKHEIPWQIGMYDITGKFMCGAVVITRSWMVTAAHCLVGYNASDITVIAGDHLLFSEEGDEQHRKLESIFTHPRYNAFTEENDISLMKLSEPLVFDGVTVLPICMLPHYTEVTGNCLVSGWGYMKEGGTESTVLRKVVVPIVSDRQCQICLKNTQRKVVNTMVCAGFPAGGKDSCQADSGGPLACQGDDGRYYLVGIVSWGKGCGLANTPGVYTEVSHFIDWIKTVMKNNFAKSLPFFGNYHATTPTK